MGKVTSHTENIGEEEDEDLTTLDEEVFAESQKEDEDEGELLAGDDGPEREGE